MPPTITRDPTGRVRIEEVDDRDCPFSILVPAPADVRGISAFSELIRIDMERARRGHIVLSAQVNTSAAFTGQYLCIEINVIGYVGASGTVLFRTAMDANQNLGEFDWDVPESYAGLGIEARQIVDGLASGVTTGITNLSLSVAGTYWR